MTTENFLLQSSPLLDVRSPSEYLHGHIPGAHSFPLFSDAERAQVGTLYKEKGKDAAVRLGLHFIGPKLSLFVENAEKLADATKSLRLYCWRGGMRSSSLAWLLQTAGFHCTLLSGGYKSFRLWTLDQFKKNYDFVVIGGLTGSGKTELLHKLKQQNEQIVDLEAIAKHRGSSFGNLDNMPQPTHEQFTNILAWQLSQLNTQRSIWIEDESRMIGTCQLPKDLWDQMSQAPFLWIQCSKEERIKRLLAIYGTYSAERLIFATQRIVKKLGAVRAEQVIQAIKNQQIEIAISIILEYYDKTYSHSCKRRNRETIFG